jgi:hypothetical protein
MAITFPENKRVSNYLVSLGLGALLGLPWLWGTIGIALSPLLVPVVIVRSNSWHRWACAFGYFLAGSAGIPGGASTFFGPGHLMMGYLLWILSAAILAFPWAWVSNGWRAIRVLIFSALPPLGIIGWLSPLTAAGFWFPGLSWIGLVFLLIMMWMLGGRKHLGIVVLATVSMIANLNYREAQSPAGWIGVDTHVGPEPKEPMAQYVRLNDWISQVRQQARDAKVVVLPETLAADWWAGTRFVLGQAVPPGQTWLVGATITDNQGTWDAIGLVRHGQVNAGPLLRAVLPVPVSMWKPWAQNGYAAAWLPSVHVIDDKRTMAVICYDQLLVWPWLEALWLRPEFIIAPGNGWWAEQGSIPTIQVASVKAWSRLMGVSNIEARNCLFDGASLLLSKARCTTLNNSTPTKIVLCVGVNKVT